MVDAFFRVAIRVGSAGLRVLWFLTRPTVHGAAVLVRHQGGLLLVRPSYRRWYALPGGSVGRREAPAAAAARELAEETGIRARPQDLRHLGELVCPHSYVQDHVHFFELSVEAEPAVRPDRREVVWAGFRPEPEVLALELWPPLRQLLERGPDRAPEEV